MENKRENTITNPIHKCYICIHSGLCKYRHQFDKYCYNIGTGIGMAITECKYHETDKELNIIDIKCKYIGCLAGMGVAGNGICFLKGNPLDKDCAKFINEEEAIKEMNK